MLLNVLEQAKKLLKSGVIKVDTTKQTKQFKRAKIDRGSTSKVGILYTPTVLYCYITILIYSITVPVSPYLMYVSLSLYIMCYNRKGWIDKHL